jgi:hypothetical protein
MVSNSSSDPCNSSFSSVSGFLLLLELELLLELLVVELLLELLLVLILEGSELLLELLLEPVTPFSSSLVSVLSIFLFGCFGIVVVNEKKVFLKRGISSFDEVQRRGAPV